MCKTHWWRQTGCDGGGWVSAAEHRAHGILVWSDGIDVLLDFRDSEPLKGSRASLVSSKASDEASSLNEYGDIDAGKFTEDGSFIGDYGTDQRPKRARAGEYMA